MDGWIRVSDKLPKTYERVLVNCDVGVREAIGFHGNFDQPYYGQKRMDYFVNVTHWMPLPKPPNK